MTRRFAVLVAFALVACGRQEAPPAPAPAPVAQEAPAIPPPGQRPPRPAIFDTLQANDEASVLAALAAEPALAAAQDDQGKTLLHWAAWQGREKLATACLAAGADPNARDAEGMTPLHWAAGRGYPTIVAALLRAGADVNAKATSPKLAGTTALHEVANGKTPAHVDCARLLLEAGAELNPLDALGHTPLYNAQVFRRTPLVVLLQEAGAEM